MDWLDIVISLATIGVSVPIIIGITKDFIKSKKEYEDAKTLVDETVEQIKDRKKVNNDTQDNVLDLMVKNVAELREYYVISKQQANRAFSSALLICFLGFLVFVIGIIISLATEQNIILYTTISGAIVELISGLFFWIYSRSQEQLNLYHERLGATEKFLVSFQVIEKISESQKDSAYEKLLIALLDGTKKRTKETLKIN